MATGPEMMLAAVAKLIPKELWTVVETGVKTMLAKVSDMDERSRKQDEKLDHILRLLAEREMKEHVNGTEPDTSLGFGNPGGHSEINGGNGAT